MNTQIEDTIDTIYIIKEKKGSGGTSSVFLVQTQNSNEKYVAKILKNEDDDQITYYNNEVHYLTILEQQHSPNIINIIGSGQGPVIRRDRNDGQPLIKRYIVLEYAPKRELADYIIYTQSGLGEEYSKLIFYKIMKGIQTIHNQGICHRDIKLENILLDDNFSPKIADFGFSTMNAPDLEDYIGTKTYASPELLANTPYDGKKSDIFSLGQTLMILTFGKGGFVKADESCKLFQKIIEGDNEGYWKIIEKNVNEGLSNDFKDLYIRMISIDPNNRPTAEVILNHDWLKTIREMTQSQLTDLENKIKKEFENREIKIEDFVVDEINEYNDKSEEIDKTRSCKDEEKFFENDINPKKAPEGLDKKFCIKINGYINPTKFMNNLCNMIIEEFGVDNCYIEPDKNKLKFKVIFEEDNEDNENQKIKGNDVTMKIKLYGTQSEFILKMTKLDGSKKNFYDKFVAISKLLKKYN